MKEIGKIIAFDEEGKAVVEFDTTAKQCPGCTSSHLCTQSGEKKRIVLEVIPGVALGSMVYVETGRRSLLRLPALAYVMVGAFLAGALVGEAIFNLLKAHQPGVLSIMAGLIVTAGCIVFLSIDEHRRRAKDGFEPSDYAKVLLQVLGI